MNGGVHILWPEGVPGGAGPKAAERTTPEGFLTDVQEPALEAWLPPAPTANGTGVVICPGGGYEFLAMGHEGAAVAQWLNTLGIAAFVLKYRVPLPGHPAPLQDVLRAIRLVRSRAAEFGIVSDRLGVWGASAGGHLAASAGTLFNEPAGRTGSPFDATSARPDFLILLYPVITFVEPCAHDGSHRALLGPAPGAAFSRKLSLEHQVTPATPPTFVVHAADDTPVPPENSFLLVQALRHAGVPVELHLYERGGHGFGLHRETPRPVAGWPARCAEWLEQHGWLRQPAT